MMPAIQEALRIAQQHDQAERWLDAVASYRAVLALDPGNIQAHNNIANVLFKMGRMEDAVDGYRRALALDPRIAEVHANVAIALLKLGRPGEAEQSYRAALAVKPDIAGLHNDLGALLAGQRRIDEAEICYRRALALKPDYAEAHDNLGFLLGYTGRMEESLRHYREALALRPDFMQAHSHLAFSTSYIPGRRAAEIYAEHLAFGQRFRQAADPRPHGVVPDPDRKLRIGYVSADFRDHAVARFMEPILAHHDGDAFEIYCYYNFPQSDAVTLRLRKLVNGWLDVHALGDETLAQRVRGDAIDILVDLSGHSAGNRLATFARKPAPMQVSYLGYPATTGLAAIDYRLTDAIVEPEGEADRCSTERLIRLPESMWCYRPDGALAATGLAPVQAGDRVTFASFNNCPKVNTELLALWAQLLARSPDSRLILTNIPVGRTQEAILRALGEAGISRSRLELYDRLPLDQFIKLFSRIDIALDTFPYAGTTTTCDLLWMGIPVVTLVGDTVASRSGASLLYNVGLQDLVARTAEQYLDIGVALAAGQDRLLALRTGLRARMAASPLMDEPRFTRNLEQAYRAIWRSWCDSRLS